MMNWIGASADIIDITVQKIMDEFENLVGIEKSDGIDSANYWLDERHNIFGVACRSMNETWIEIHYELYDEDGEIVGDLTVSDTRDTSRSAIEEEITAIVRMYYGE